MSSVSASCQDRCIIKSNQGKTKCHTTMASLLAITALALIIISILGFAGVMSGTYFETTSGIVAGILLLIPAFGHGYTAYQYSQAPQEKP